MSRTAFAAILILIGSLSAAPGAPDARTLRVGVEPGAQQPAAPPRVPARPPSDELLARLPADWQQPVATWIRVTDADQARMLKQDAAILRQVLIRLLVRTPAADAFVQSQLTKDASPQVRTTIVQLMANDARWSTMGGTPALIEAVIANDPDPAVSAAALETLRRWRMRDLNAMLNARLAAAKARGEDAKGLARLVAEQERWVALERGTMLPAFLRTPPPVFGVKGADSPIRVLAFGDFGTGSPEQISLARTIGAYHKKEKFDLALTLGDNFYSVGMESPDDPRWQTQFEELYGGLGVTFYPAFGNHDWGHPDSPSAEILYSHKTSSWRMPAAYYTFTAGPVQFFALDTQVIALAEAQRQWLDRELARSTARWKVVYGHHPIYSGGNYEDRPDLIDRLMPILRNRADVYLCGHDHNLQALQPQDGVRFYIAGGGGAGLYELRPYERSIFASRTNGFAVIEAETNQLTVKLVDGVGAVVFKDTIVKPPTTNAPQR